MTSMPPKGKPEYLPMSFGEILGNALKYWISGFRYYFPLYLAVQLAMAGLALGLIVVSVYNPWILMLSSAFLPALGLGSLLATIYYLSPIDLTVIGFIGVFIVIIVIYEVLGLLVTGTVIQHAADAHAGLKPGLGQSFRLAKGRVVSLFGATILSTLITLSFLAAPFAVLGILLLGIFVLIWNPFLWLALFIVVIALSVASMILLIYVVVRLSVFAPAVVLGGAAAVTSLRQSWRITHGHFWRVFAITVIIGLILSAITTLPVSFTMFSIFLPFSPWVSLALTIVFIVAYACSMSLSPIVQAMLYKDLSARYFGA